MTFQSTVADALTLPDKLVLQRLLLDAEEAEREPPGHEYVITPAVDGKDGEEVKDIVELLELPLSQESTLKALEQLNDSSHARFDPTVFILWDLRDLEQSLPRLAAQRVLHPYIRWARTIVRVDTDIVMLTHLLLYFTTSIPSALYLFYRFTWLHAVLHWVMQSYYVGTYSLMMHQHIHMSGILASRFRWFDLSFPYLLDPLFGHTWNTYYYHHVKHHHVESNGPDDLSSTIRYQRDNVFHLLRYICRFFFLIWLDLPRYFIKKGKYGTAIRAALSEVGALALYCVLATLNFRATLFTVLLEFVLLRIGLMVGNWGQHAFVDEVEPSSDFRSSITLIDVASNRFCFNDGYHTSHHLNPRRHWRHHPIAFLKQKQKYADEHALVFSNIDYIMVAIRLMMKDYAYLARCMVPIGAQAQLSMEERAAMLETKTRRFTEEEILKRFG